MGREILSRGKRKDNGKWIEGYYQKRYDSFENIQHLIFWAKSYTVWEYAEVDPETVCQYTGLTDRNGKRFGGDIFQASDGDYIQRYIIVWNEDSLEWTAECIGDPDGTLPLCEFKVGEIDVIGNLWDNPELLNQ